MDLDESYVITGPTATSLHRIKNRVSNLVLDCRFFYIGLTNNPRRRFREHLRKDEVAWDRMVVLYETSSALKEGNFEEELILYYRESNSYSKKLKNKKNGRQGRLCYPPHYIYVLLKY